MTLADRRLPRPTPAALVQQCLRWSHRRHSYRPAGEVVDTSRMGVEPIEESAAKAFIRCHHYAASYPAARYRAGLFEKDPFMPARLVGVAVFSVPMSRAVLTKYLGEDGADDGVELGRLCLLDHTGANSESWFLSRAFKLLRRDKGIRGLVSFCDPVPRFDALGRQTKRSHTGTIYRAMSARYEGTTLPRTLSMMPNGLVASERALSKIRKREQGYDYAMRQLLDAGAPTRMLGAAAARWRWR